MLIMMRKAYVQVLGCHCVAAVCDAPHLEGKRRPHARKAGVLLKFYTECSWTSFMAIKVGIQQHLHFPSQQKERWGNEAAFQAWKRNTNLLVPIPK